MGASSARIALGRLEDGKLSHHTVEQLEHRLVGRCWDVDLLRSVCQRALETAREHGASLGIDSWGVDIGLIRPDGTLLPPVCYRDESHGAAHARLAGHHEELFRMTGVAAQPFNTVFQLAARAEEDPTLPREAEWLLLPDLFAHLLGAPKNYEATISSTTQLVGLDGAWADEAFALCGWPAPNAQPKLGGTVELEGATLVRVAGHDTACAVLGLGPFAPGEAFANLGTWTLVGMVVPEAVVTDEALALGWTNELDATGQTRLLKNVPGSYIANRVHAELFPGDDLATWLDSANPDAAVLDVHDPRLFNPRSMASAVSEVLGTVPVSKEDWAGTLVCSHAQAVAQALNELGSLVGRQVTGVVVGGGMANCRPLMARLSEGCRVRRGPSEATVVGNLVAQFRARGAQGG